VTPRVFIAFPVYLVATTIVPSPRAEARAEGRQV
jgi:hypothetical protein